MVSLPKMSSNLLRNGRVCVCNGLRTSTKYWNKPCLRNRLITCSSQQNAFEEVTSIVSDFTSEDILDIVDDGDLMLGLDSSSTAAPPINEKEEEDEAPDAEINVLTKKTMILMEMLKAGDKLEEKIAEFRDEIDDSMLTVLAQRLTSARKYQQGSVAAQNLESLHSILTLEYKRQNSSPALRLLDEVLDLLGDDCQSADYEDRKKDATLRLQEAFSGGGFAGFDIFAAAAALAESPALAADELASEMVNIPDFLLEVTALLESVRQQQDAANMDIKNAEKQYKYLREERPVLLQHPDVKRKLKLLKEAKSAFEHRATSIMQLEEIVYISRRLERELLRL